MTTTRSRFPFPATFRGWYVVAYSNELPVEGVLPLHYFGTDLVLFRTGDGIASMLDAHCPHLGAHLGHGGRVVGEAIECPFHGWRIGADGACAGIPYASKIPPKASTRVWGIREHSGLLLARYDGGGTPVSWQVPEIPECASVDYAVHERRRWSVRSHAQEIAENFVDGAHFKSVHGTVTVAETSVETDGPNLRSISVTGMQTPRGDVPATIEIVGHGIGIWIIRPRGLTDVILVSSLTPIDDETVDARAQFLVRPSADEAAARLSAAFIADVKRQIEQDIVIWEHKIYRASPPLCAGEGAISTLRNWSRQFWQ